MPPHIFVHTHTHTHTHIYIYIYLIKVANLAVECSMPYKQNVAREESHCRLMGYSFRLAARVLLYAPSHRQDGTYHGLWETSRGALSYIHIYIYIYIYIYTYTHTHTHRRSTVMHATKHSNARSVCGMCCCENVFDKFLSIRIKQS